MRPWRTCPRCLLYVEMNGQTFDHTCPRVKVVEDRPEMVRLLRSGRCVVEGCVGLLGESERGDHYIACDATSSHAFKKEDLYYLRPKVLSATDGMMDEC